MNNEWELAIRGVPRARTKTKAEQQAPCRSAPERIKRKWAVRSTRVHAAFWFILLYSIPGFGVIITVMQPVALISQITTMSRSIDLPISTIPCCSTNS